MTIQDDQRIIVAVATFKRPHLLDDLLHELTTQAGELELPCSVLVVDNDSDGTARDTVAAWAPRGVTYVIEPRPGIAAARNRAIEEARGADALVFIDDDELPAPRWLTSLVASWRKWGCAAVAGPVAQVLGEEADDWVRACPEFQVQELPTGTTKGGAGTGNLLLDLGFLESVGLRFDDRFGLAGGSDTLLTHTLVARGGQIRWCAEALATEPVPPQRATRAWVLRRNVRTGNDWSRVHLQLAAAGRPRLRTRLELAARAVLLIGWGVLRALLGRIKGDLALRSRAECQAASGWGVLRGVVGRVVIEYMRTSEVVQEGP